MNGALAVRFMTLGPIGGEVYMLLQGKGISLKYLAAVCLVALLCGCSRFIGDGNGLDTTVWQAFFQYTKAELSDMGEFGAAYQAVIGFRDSDWFVVLLPALVSFPFIYDFDEQWFGGSYYLVISRQTKCRYTVQTMLHTAGTGFGIFISGALIYSFFVVLKFPCGISEPEQSAIAAAYGATVLQRGLSFIQELLHTGCLSALLVMISVLLTVLFKNRFLALSLPVLVEYMSGKLLYVFQRYRFLQETDSVAGEFAEFLLPSKHLYYDQNFASSFGVGYWFYLIFLLFLFVMMTAVFRRMVERR